MYRPGQQISNRFKALSGETEKQCTKGGITLDSGAAGSVWLEGLMPEVQTKPSVDSQSYPRSQREGIGCPLGRVKRPPRAWRLAREPTLGSTTAFAAWSGAPGWTGCEEFDKTRLRQSFA